MEIIGIIGMILGFGVVVAGILLSGQLMSFWDAASVMIVMGGTVAATMVAINMEQLKSIPKLMGFAFKKTEYNHQLCIAEIIRLANTARKEGLLALEETVSSVDDHFLKKGIMLVVDGTDPELVKNILETEISFVEARHNSGSAIFETMGSLAPAFGMIGTLVGLINMLQNMSDPSSIGPQMSVALVTTFYGSMLANMIFIPVANKLKLLSSDELLYKEILLEGIMSIQAGENPRIIEEKLTVFLAHSAGGKGGAVDNVKEQETD